MAGELLEFEDGTEGIALNLEDDNVGAVLMVRHLASKKEVTLSQQVKSHLFQLVRQCRGELLTL